LNYCSEEKKRRGKKEKGRNLRKIPKKKRRSKTEVGVERAPNLIGRGCKSFGATAGKKRGKKKKKKLINIASVGRSKVKKSPHGQRSNKRKSAGD